MSPWAARLLLRPWTRPLGKVSWAWVAEGQSSGHWLARGPCQARNDDEGHFPPAQTPRPRLLRESPGEVLTVPSGWGHGSPRPAGEGPLRLWGLHSPPAELPPRARACGQPPLVSAMNEQEHTGRQHGGRAGATPEVTVAARPTAYEGQAAEDGMERVPPLRPGARDRSSPGPWHRMWAVGKPPEGHPTGTREGEGMGLSAWQESGRVCHRAGLSRGPDAART